MYRVEIETWWLRPLASRPRKAESESAPSRRSTQAKAGQWPAPCRGGHAGALPAPIVPLAGFLTRGPLVFRAITYGSFCR
jgi:hypothetical protein